MGSQFLCSFFCSNQVLTCVINSQKVYLDICCHQNGLECDIPGRFDDNICLNTSNNARPGCEIMAALKSSKLKCQSTVDSRPAAVSGATERPETVECNLMQMQIL